MKKSNIYHLYQRTIMHKGKKVKAWYYWFYDETGKQVRKTCGSNGKLCLLKREAEEFLISLIKNEPEQRTGKTIKDLCTKMYDQDSDYLKKRAAKGYEVADITRRIKKRLCEYFIEKYGHLYPDQIEISDIEDWLLGINWSNSRRNSMIQVIKEIYNYAYTQKAIKTIPLLTGFKVNKISKKGVLTRDEIDRLFPDDYDKAVNLWKRYIEPDYISYMLCCMCYITLSSGMRSGEVRALQYNQFIAEDTIFLNASICDEKRVNYLKKANSKTNKWRIAIIPDKAVKMLRTLKEKEIAGKVTDYVFEHNCKSVRKEFLNERFQYVLEKKLGINYKERHLCIHSLRFTYNTLMRKEISGDDLRAILGHTSQTMTDYYDKSTVLDKLPELVKNKNAINEIWK